MKTMKSNVRGITIFFVIVIVLAVAVCLAACSEEESSPSAETDSGTEEGPEPQIYECLFVDGITDEIIETQFVTEGTSADMPDPPEHEHYEFSEWTYNGTAVALPFFPTENCAVKAEYELMKYSYTFTVDGEAISTGKADALSEIDAPTPPKKEHMTFVG